MTKVLRTIFLCALALAVTAAGAGPAHASSKQVTIMQDDGLLFRSGGAVRDQTLDEMAALGADVIKAQVYWNEISPPCLDVITERSMTFCSSRTLPGQS